MYSPDLGKRMIVYNLNLNSDLDFVLTSPSYLYKQTAMRHDYLNCAECTWDSCLGPLCNFELSWITWHLKEYQWDPAFPTRCIHVSPAPLYQGSKILHVVAIETLLDNIYDRSDIIRVDNWINHINIKWIRLTGLPALWSLNYGSYSVIVS